MLMPVLEAIWAFVSATPALVPLILLPAGAWLVARTWQSPAAVPSIRWWTAGALLVFGALDWAVLSALPRLGLSFGPVGLPLLGISAVRLILTLALVWIWQQGGYYWPQMTSVPGLAVGVAALWLLNLGVLACEMDGLYVEPFALSVPQVDVPGPDFLPDKPLRIVQLSDLHVERTTKRELELIERVNTLEPDIIVLTGDYLSTSFVDDPVARQDARELLSRLYAPHGIYAIKARAVDSPEAMAAMFDGLDIIVLYDQVRRLPFESSELYLVGVSYLDRKRDGEAFSSLMTQVPEDAYSLLLYHTPDLAKVAAEEGVDLYLAGHTHGGQIRLPIFGALFTASAHGKRYEQGQYSLGDTTLYVSRGIGMEGMGAPRARFLCPPEIVVLDFGNSQTQ